LLARQLAGCFVTAPQTYAKDIIRQNGKDSDPLDRVLQPNAQRPTFTGKVALLIGPENMSSCESFIMMMKTCPNCTTIGQKTWGSSGNPKPHDLGNGVTVMLPSWRDLRVDGTCFEGEGLTPDIIIADLPDASDDPVLDKALAVLRGTN
jgi:C-terminal processing protease CtpA/Prc